MTIISILAEGTVAIPSWVLTIAISIMVTLFTAWGILSATKANLEVRAARNEEDIKCLQAEKVNREEFKMVYDMLKSIDKKIDHHIKDDA